jgi:hypothetical protein
MLFAQWKRLAGDSPGGQSVREPMYLLAISEIMFSALFPPLSYQSLLPALSHWRSMRLLTTGDSGVFSESGARCFRKRRAVFQKAAGGVSESGARYFRERRAVIEWGIPHAPDWRSSVHAPARLFETSGFTKCLSLITRIINFL